MSTLSRTARTSLVDRTGEAMRDTITLLHFRGTTLRGRQVTYARLGLAAMVLITVLAAWLPGYLPDGNPSRIDVAILIPSLCLGLLLLATVAAATSGGGREILSRDQGSAYPLDPVVDHFGALALAPLNIAWLIQTWLLLGSVAYAFGSGWTLAPIQVITLLWVVAATAAAQAFTWVIEWLRRGPGGAWVVRGGGVLFGVGIAVLVWSGTLGHLLDRSLITRWVLVGQLNARSTDWWPWLRVVGELVALLVAAVAVGAWLAVRVARRMPRDQARFESVSHRPRPAPHSDLGVLLRTDHASVWRSVPLRRGLITLGVLPGAVALLGSMQWQAVTLLPGLVCSGAALLFGVNLWCLDGTGAMWRESLPVDPGLALAARILALAEVLVVAIIPTLVLASFRAGVPTPGEAAAVLAAAVASTLHVVASCVHWSLTTPYAANLADARATPAPPLAMVGYSARLAAGTTALALIFYGTSQASPSWSILVALPIVLFSAARIAGAFTTWGSPEVRAHVLSTVSG